MLDKAVAYVEPGPREQIITVNKINRVKFYRMSSRDLDRVKFYRISNRDLMFAIQKFLRPPSNEDFLRTLDSATTFFLPDNFELTLPRVSYFCTQLKTCVRDFQESLEFLSKKNSKNIPVVGSSKEGLINAFLKKLPEHYAKSMRDTNTRYTSLDPFFADFLAEAKATYRIARSAKKVSPHVSKSKASHFVPWPPA